MAKELKQNSPHELLVRMGIVPERKIHDKVSELSRRNFEWVNLASGDVPIGPVLEAIKTSDTLNPPRTGHMGGVWQTIVQGGGAELMLNEAVRQQEVGYPLIFDFNEIPSADGRSGDTLYHPASIKTKSGWVDLDLYDAQGNPLDRSYPIYAPYAFTKVKGSLVPISAIHKTEMKGMGSDIAFISEVFVKNAPRVRTLLNGLLSTASYGDDDPREQESQAKILKLIVDRSVNKDGRVRDTQLKRSRGKFTLAGTEYSQEQLVDMIMLSLEIADNPNIFRDRYFEIPEHMPRISKELLAATMAVLDVDFTDGTQSLTPINPHFHWGAFQMAGAPPLQEGYFSSSAGGIAHLITMMRLTDKTIPPVYYVLMPASIFTLLPSSCYPKDVTAVAELFQLIHERSDSYKGKPSNQMKAIQDVVQDWYSRNQTILSDSFKSRFSPYDSTRTNYIPYSPELTTPEGFDTLTFRQATIAVGYLKQVVQ